MPLSMHFFPFFGSLFPTTDLIAHDRIENLCAASGERVQTRITQRLKGHLNRNLEDALGKVANLDGSECFNMEAGIKCAKASQKPHVPFARQGRMKPAAHINFGDPKMERLTCCLDDLGDGHLECMRVAFPGAKSAELARENADVRIIDVPIQDVGGAIPIFSLPNDIGDQPEFINICGAVEARCFVLGDPSSCHDLIIDRAQFLRNEAYACEIFHKLTLTQYDSPIKLAANFLRSEATFGVAACCRGYDESCPSNVESVH